MKGHALSGSLELFQDFVKIGGTNMPIIAATSGELIARNDYDKSGLTEIETKIGNATAKRPLRVLTLDLSAGIQLGLRLNF